MDQLWNAVQQKEKGAEKFFNKTKSDQGKKYDVAYQNSVILAVKVWPE